MSDAPAMSKKLKVLDLFSGIGGFSLGLERTGGFETVAFCEIEPFCQKVLKKHWPDVPIHNDVREVRGSEYRESVDVICGGFPCQDLSTAGRQEGINGERSGLWREIVRLTGEIRPRYLIVENVTNLLSGERGNWFSRVLGDLAEIGYDAEWHCVPASAVGAPHIRDRVWIIANPKCERPQGQGQCVNAIHPAPNAYREADRLVRAVREKDLPFVCRGHDGLSDGVDRLRALGNAVVPQVVSVIGHAILAQHVGATA